MTAAIKERPILFSAPMVRALLDGSKTQTRRVCKPMNAWVEQTCREVRAVDGVPHHFLKGATEPLEKLRCPYGQPGELLWVRETWAPHPDFPRSVGRTVYRADPECEHDVERWYPSIHMRREYSRILLEIVLVRVERLNDIGTEEIEAEGVVTSHADIMEYGCRARVIDFSKLWESINGAGSWAANPWAWVVEFKRVAP
jgi:hypothetical protein